ncbi:MAG TPA: DNA-binding response regulator, partial [Lachnospiraceae bacterium]|nr:DNA-binding response regulator [Lachnospiraceae bacterium]
MNGKGKLLIVEDEENIRRELEIYLAAAGYKVALIQDFSNMVEEILIENPDLVLLDVNLPGASGLEICEQIRKTSQVPIIFVTGNNTSMDELNCILRGGDDYVSKPYQLPVLMARIAAVLRRTLGNLDTDSMKLEYKGVLLDIASAQISKGIHKRELTKNELKILHCLYLHSGEIVSRMDMIDFLWDNEVFIDDNT